MKRLFAVLLAFIMTVGAAPLSAVAASYDKRLENEIRPSPAVSTAKVGPYDLNDDLFGFYPRADATQTQTPTDASSVSMEATDSFGQLILDGMDDFSEETNSTSYSENNRVTRIEMQGSTAVVSYCVEEDADLVVALYTEDGKEMIASGTTSVSATGDGQAMVEIEGSMPTYYIAKGFLLEKNDHGALSPVYVTQMYTEDMIDLKEAKASDYDPERVLNLDGNDETNFAVVTQGVKLMKHDESLGRAAGSESRLADSDDDNLIYTFENADDELLGLRQGEIFVYEYGENSLLVARVKKKVVNGTTVTIYGDETLDITDVFETMKIEQSADGSQFEYEEGSSGDGVEYLGLVETPQEEVDETNGVFDGLFEPKQDHVTGSYSMAFKLGGKKPINAETSVEGSGSITLTASIDFAYYIAARRQYVALVASKSIDGSVTIKGANKTEKPEWKLAAFTLHPIPGIAIGLEPSFFVEVSGAVTAKFKTECKSGGSWESGVGYTNLSTAGSSKITVTGEIEVYVGIDLHPKVEVAGKVLSVEVKTKAGIDAKFTDTVHTSSGSEIHACQVCFDFTIKGRAEVGIGIKLFGSEKFKFEWTFAKLELQLPNGRGRGYWSMTYNELRFNQSCPHKKYRIKVMTDGTGHEGDSVYVSGISEPVAQLDQEGNASFYLEPGTYRVSANTDGRVYSSQEFEVSDHTLEIHLQYVSSGRLSGKVCMASDRATPIENAQVEVSQDGIPVVKVRADQKGRYSLTLRSGSYQIKISADGYIAFSTTASIQPESDTYLETFLMVQGQEGDMGTANGYLRNTLTGKGVAGASLTIRRNWNNTTGDIVVTVTTDSNGYYTVELPVGNYTVTAEKAGYVQSSFNIVVQANNDYQQNGTISPIVESLDQVMITLQWGVDPRDLDSHLVGTRADGSQFHVYFGNKDAYDGNVHVANLDVDDVTSYGPEHITLNPTTTEPYYYYVYHYAGSGSLATSEAQITIHVGNTEIMKLNVPIDQGTERYWNVFAIVDGHLIIRDTITGSPELSYASVDGIDVATFALDGKAVQFDFEKITAETELAKDTVSDVDLAA